MHFIKSIAFACAALCATQANALDNATMNSAGTLKVYVSGSSDLSELIYRLFYKNCVASTRTDYTYTNIYPGTISAEAFGTIYSCTLVGGNDFGLPGNVNIMFQKRDAGGSDVGVYPVSNNTPIEFINPWSCTGDALGMGTCTVLFQRTADGGISELEPEMFTASSNTSVTFVGSALGHRSTSVPTGLQTIYGLAVTNALYTALQTEQGLTSTQRPSIPKAVAGQMLRNNFTSDPIAWKLLLPNATAAVQEKQVNICRRLNGSGTQAAANRYFLEYPFNSGTTQEPLAALDSTVAGFATDTPNALYVQENSATAAARNCMTNANTAGAFALGHISLENAPTAAWKFVKLDGQEPSRDEAKAGRYAYMFESTGQVSNLAPANVQSFLYSFFNRATGSPINLGALTTATQNGVMARPQTTVCPSTFGATTYGAADAPLTGAVPAVVTTFCSRVTRNGNSTEFPGFFR
jgi:hypothetical protein